MSDEGEDRSLLLSAIAGLRSSMDNAAGQVASLFKGQREVVAALHEHRVENTKEQAALTGKLELLKVQVEAHAEQEMNGIRDIEERVNEALTIAQSAEAKAEAAEAFSREAKKWLRWLVVAILLITGGAEGLRSDISINEILMAILQ
jgi:23S rRNA pseudoU1915 N3-methylase RlmH